MEGPRSIWQGHKNLDKLFIFGDSYSSVLKRGESGTTPCPTADLPLGVPFPGHTWTGGKGPNWVGHLVNAWSEKPLLIYDFALGGDTVCNMKAAIEGPYQELVDSRCKCNEHWKPGTSLFVFWIGINDLACLGDEQPIKDRVTELFCCVQTVYNSGARAFLFIDLPPVNRAPLIVRNEITSDKVAWAYSIWNKDLNEMIQHFSAEYIEASCFQYSSFRLLTSILDDPVEYGFERTDAQKRGGAIWADHIHLTSAVHEWLAQDIGNYLMTI